MEHKTENKVIGAVQYEYVKVKEPFNFYAFLKKLRIRLFENPTQFLWNMIFYHIEILFFTFLLRAEMPGKVILRLGLGDVSAVYAEMHAIQTWQSIVTNWLFLGVILFLDFALLLILKSEFKWLKLSYKKILILELLVFLAGYFNPYVRTALLFFSANTLQITIAYRWFIKKWKFFQYFFIAGSYILILRLLFHVVILIIWG